MDFKIKQSVLNKALASVSGIVEKKNSIPVLQNVLIESLGENTVRVTATDLDVSLRLDIDAEVSTPGALCLAGRKLIDITRNLPNVEMCFRRESNAWATIVADKSKYRIPGTNSSSFPAMPRHEGSWTALDAEMIKSMIKRTLFAASTQQSNFSMDGINLELNGELRMVATDKYRVAIATDTGIDAEEKATIMLPRKAAAEILKLSADELRFAHDNHHIFLSSENLLFSARRSAAMFPNYRAIIPTEFQYVATFNVEEMKAALRRAGTMSDNELGSLRFELHPGEIVLTSVSREEGEAVEHVSAEYDGEPFTTGFVWSHLLEFLNAAGDAEKARLSVKENRALPDLLEIVGDDSYQYLPVPVNIVLQQQNIARGANARG